MILVYDYLRLLVMFSDVCSVGNEQLILQKRR